MSDSDVEMAPGPSKLAYDPDQDPEEKRKVRKEYRSLHKDAEEKQANPNEYSADQLADKVRHADVLFDKVKGPQEATLDSAFLVMASNMGAQKARAMKSGGSAFDVDEFVAKLITFMGGRRPLEDQIPEDSDVEADDGDAPLDWEKIGRKTLAKSRRVPVMDFMLGPLSTEQKKKKSQAGKRAKLEKSKDEEKRPQELKEEDIARSQNETTKNVATVEKLLAQQGRINLFKFIVNPHDFAQSVENMFYLSFLIRDGKCALDMEEGEPIIYTCDPPSDVDYVEGLKKRQVVMEFDMATWRRAIEVFNIVESKIPQRPPA